MEKNPAWRGGRVKHSSGYIRIKLRRDDPYFPMADKQGYVFEHRLVLAHQFGRCLTHREVVHHANVDRDDNRAEVLEVHTNAEHTHIHHPRQTVYKVCSWCGRINGYRPWQIVQNKTGHFFCNRREGALYQHGHRKKTTLVES